MKDENILVSGVIQYTMPIIKLTIGDIKPEFQDIVNESKKNSSLKFAEEYISNFEKALNLLGIPISDKKIIEIGFLDFYLKPNEFEISKKIEKELKDFSSKTLISVDPMTYGLLMMKREILKKYKITVVPVVDVILEKLRTRSITKISKKITLHEPCWYARWTDKITELNEIMKITCENFIKSRYHGVLSVCCGALLGLTNPKMAIPAGKEALNILKLSGADTIVTACPICYVFFKKISDKLVIMDLSELLLQALGEK